MLNTLVDTRDVRFVLFELLKIHDMTSFKKYSSFDRDIFDSTIELAEKVSVMEFQPTAEEGDREGCRWDPDTKKVTIPGCYKPALDAYYEAGFMGISDSEAIGGMGMPHVVSAAVGEFTAASNYPLMMYPGLTHGCMELIAEFGNDNQKALYIEKMMSGRWGGTMCITEPEAGSDVGALKSKAVKQEDGSYRITGLKIFISSGDNDYYENIIHAVLARIEGDPAGTKGLSLFLVPKYRINGDGGTGEFNDVICTGIEHKMGIKGSSTASLSFGDDGNCVGHLLGEERKGIRYMFQMMNFARMATALAGQANASAAYMHSVTYAKGRLQGAHVTQMMNPEAPSVSIIEHPDVKRMLLWMKSHLEGQRMLINFMYQSIDHSRIMEGENAREADALVELLTPICKAGCSDMGVLICSEAMQVLGGYGYCSDYPVEKFMRDSKILAIWEGTNGIQSLDLSMRKILMNPEQYNYGIFKKRVAETAESARGVIPDEYIDIIMNGLEKLDEVIESMKAQLGAGKFLHLFMNATPLQKAMYMLALAWMHLWSLTISLPKMKSLVGDRKGAEREALLADNDEAAFYSGKVLSSQFYIGTEFPKYFGKIDSILRGESAVVKASAHIFTGAPDE